jgi:hypothetical protein
MSTPEPIDKGKNMPPIPPEPKTDVELMQENEMLKARLSVRENQLRQAVDIANKANDQNKAKDSAQKEMLITSIQMDSHFTKDELTQKSLMELQTMRLTLDKSMEKTFANVAAEIDEAKHQRKRKSPATIGNWDSVKKEWIGGMQIDQ